MKNEVEYRKKIQEVFDRVQSAFEDVDPDVAECEQSLGAMTVVFANHARCILSAQPSIYQLWLALASQGTAYHFKYDEKSGSWMDDKGRGIELMTLLQKVFQESIGPEVKFHLQAP
jgi:CyaY protein